MSCFTIRVAFVCAIAFALSPLRLATAGYVFTKITDSAGPYQSFSTPTLNNSGTVAISAGRMAPADTIVLGDGGPLQVLYAPGGPLSGASNPSINDNGTVAFYARTATGEPGIFKGDGGPVTPIAVVGPGNPFADFVGQVINNAGTVAFFVYLNSHLDEIYTGDGGSLTIIHSAHSIYQGASIPALNNQGVVAFSAGLLTGNASILTGTGGPLTVLYDTSGPFARDTANPSINDQATVAFYSPLKGGGAGIFVGDGGPVTTIVTNTSGAFSDFGFPGINDSNTVVFVGFLRTGGEGIFFGADPVADRVIDTGDTLFGRTVTGIAFDPLGGLNDRGQIAFSATFADGTSGVFRADPAAVAEPSSLVLAAIAIFLGSAISVARLKARRTANCLEARARDLAGFKAATTPGRPRPQL